MKRFVLKKGDYAHILKCAIESDRLALVPISQAYAADIFQEFTADITKYMVPSPANSISETRQFISESMFGMKLGSDLVFSITKKSSGEFLGACGCYCEDVPERPELGLWIKKSAQGQKFGQDSITLLMSWLQRHIEYDYLVYPVSRANIASRRIPEFLGGVVVEERQVVSWSGKTLDEVVYHIKNSAD